MNFWKMIKLSGASSIIGISLSHCTFNRFLKRRLFICFETYFFVHFEKIVIRWIQQQYLEAMFLVPC